VRNNAIIIFSYAFGGLVISYWIWKRHFRKYF
jgi:hypothetical protein